MVFARVRGYFARGGDGLCTSGVMVLQKWGDDFS